MKRLFFIHGYVESPAIFDQLCPLLPPAESVRINLADAFARWQPAGPVNVVTLAQYLTDTYQIAPDDVVIGHSMGGWIAVHIKQLTGATAVQIGSWTDQKRINFPVSNLTVLRWMLFSGLTQSRPSIRYFKKMYPFAESRGLYDTLIDGMATMNRPYVYQQLQVLFARVPALTVQPDLRIHARPDNIVFPPDEPFMEVPGDHFCLVYHAPLIADAITRLLTTPAHYVVTT